MGPDRIFSEVEMKCPECGAMMVPVETVGYTPNTLCVICKLDLGHNQDGTVSFARGGIFYHDELGHYAHKEHTLGQTYLGSVRPSNS